MTAESCGTSGCNPGVTARVPAELALAAEREPAAGYLARIERPGDTDPLTGLPNRRRAEQRVETALWDIRSAGSALALLFVDLNGFKAVNDRHGHAAGDIVLVATAGRLPAGLRRTDLLAAPGRR